MSGVNYLFPKNSTNKNMDIEGPSKSEDAHIQIWTKDPNFDTPQFKWTIC